MKRWLILILALCATFAAVTACKGRKESLEKLGIVKKPRIARIVATEYRAVNKSGQVTKIIPEKIHGTITSICDEKGRVVEEIHEPVENKSYDKGCRYLMEYNDKDLLVKNTCMNSVQGGKAIYALSYSYDGKGNVSEYYEAWPPDFEPKLEESYSYDDKNRMTTKIRYHGNTQDVTTYTYENPSPDVEIRTERYGEYTKVLTKRFDSKKRVIESRWEDGSFELYEYDDNDNWIKMTEGGSEYKMITERVITYR